MSDPSGDAELLKAAFALVAEHGWHRFSRAELARRAGQPLTRVAALLPTRGHLPCALGHHLDRAMLAIELAELDEMSPRERVFELVMRRLDAMAPFKAGLRVLSREAGLAPELLAGAIANLGRMTGWLLEASGAELGRTRRAAAAPVLALAYGRVVKVWLDDDTTDLARTLAELDRRLRQAENIAQMTGWLDRMADGRRRTAADPEPTATATA